jgi:hypothetical protein
VLSGDGQTARLKTHSYPESLSKFESTVFRIIITRIVFCIGAAAAGNEKPTHEEFMAHQEIRALLAWMDRDEAVSTQLGAHLPIQGQDINPQLARWNSAREKIQERSEYDLPTPTLEPLPGEMEDQGQAFLNRPDILGAFQGWNISVGLVDLKKILSFQKCVTSDATERAAGIDIANPGALFSFCLPEAAAPVEFPVSIDNDYKGFSIASANPNIRVNQGQMANIGNQQFFGFSIGFGSTFVQVVEYQGRWFIRDGYHRCYGLLRRGVDKIPCLFIRARDVREFGGVSAFFFRGETIFGPRPPFLRDFLDDEVTENAARPVAGKVIRITAQEFNVQLN